MLGYCSTDQSKIRASLGSISCARRGCPRPNRKPLSSGKSTSELLRIVIGNNGAVDFFQQRPEMSHTSSGTDVVSCLQWELQIHQQQIWCKSHHLQAMSVHQSMTAPSGHVRNLVFLFPTEHPRQKQPPISSTHLEYNDVFERKHFYSKKLWPPSHLQTPECFLYSHVKIRHGSLNELVIVKDSSHKPTSSSIEISTKWPKWNAFLEMQILLSIAWFTVLSGISNKHFIFSIDEKNMILSVREL